MSGWLQSGADDFNDIRTVSFGDDGADYFNDNRTSVPLGDDQLVEGKNGDNADPNPGACWKRYLSDNVGNGADGQATFADQT